MKTKHNRTRALSLLMSLVMMFSLAVPAFAAEASEAMVLIYQDGTLIDADARNSDGNKDILTVGALEVDSMTVNGVAVSSEDWSKTQSAAPNLSVNGADMTEGSYKVYTATTNGVQTVRLSWSNLKTSLEVNVKTKAHSDFTVKADCVPAGGCVFGADQVQKVNANGTYRMAFSPKAAQLEISSFIIKAGGDSQTVKVPVSDTATVTIAGQTVNVVPTNNGGVRVDIIHVSQDTEIIAQVSNQTNKYTLDVSTDNHCNSDVTTDVVEQDATKSVVLTPDRGYNIADVVITINGKSETIKYDQTSAKVNGQTFELTRRLDGSATLSVPAMKADVDVYAKAANDIYAISVDSGKNATSEQDGTRFISASDPFVVTLEPKRDASLVSVKVTTADGTFYADADDNYLVVNGVYNKIYTSRNGVMTIYFYDLRGNMKIEANARDTIHDVDIGCDARITADTKDTTVDDGDDMNIVFTPESGYDIRTIRVVYDGATYTADPTTSSYIRVDGMRWDMKTDKDGVVTLYMEDIKADVDVYASTRKNASIDTGRNYRITKNADSHSTISVSGGSTFYYGDTTTVHVYSDKNYVIKSVRFTMNGKSAEIEHFDTSFTLDGEKYTVDWDTNTDLEVDMEVYGNMTIRAISKRGDAQENNSNGQYRVTTSTDSRSNITVKPNSSKYSKGQAIALDVTADKNYVLKSIKLTMNGKSATVEPFASSFNLDGQVCTIRWTSNRDCEIGLNMNGNLSVTTKTARGDEELWSGTTFPPVPPVINVTAHPAYMSGYGNGLFGPSNNMTRAEAITIMCRLYAPNAAFGNYANYDSFNDVPAGRWYSGFVGYAKSAGLLNVLVGSGSELKPSQAITRAEFLALLCDFAGKNVAGTNTASRYSDVPSSHWAIKYINYATEQSWVSGIGGGLFQPDRNVSRTEICVMLNRITGRIPGGAYAVYNTGFTDVQPSFWGYADIMEATNSHNVSSIQNGVEVWSF